MKGIVFAPKYNSPGLKDADECQREAKLFAEGRACKVVIFDNHGTMTSRLTALKQALSSETELDYIVFCCHGWADGIQAGLRRKDLPDFVKWLKPKINTAMFRVILYCCLTAEDGVLATDDMTPANAGEGGFADKFADELWWNGVNNEVTGHVKKGHLTKNPHVRTFTGSGDGEGGEWRVVPHTDEWPKWVKSLTTKYRFDFPFETHEQTLARARSAS